MAVVVEDGTGLTNATVYDSLANVSAHHAARGRTSWASLASDAIREEAMIRATDYLDFRFGRRLRGYRKTSGQALAVPRTGAYDNSGYELTGVPRIWKKAFAEYALIASRIGELAPNPPSPVGSQVVATGVAAARSGYTGIVTGVRQKVDSIESELTFATQASTKSSSSRIVEDFNIPEYPMADLWIEELLRGNLDRDVLCAG